MENRKYSVVAVLVIILTACVLLSACNGGTKTYVGSNNNIEVTIVLKPDNSFTFTTKSLISGSEIKRDGSYEYVDSQESVIKFTYRDTGKSFNCSVMYNLRGTPYLAIHSVYSDYPPCYLT